MQAALQVSHAFHSPRMAPMLEAFETIASQVVYAPPRVGVISNLTGQLTTGEELCRAQLLAASRARARALR